MSRHVLVSIGAIFCSVLRERTVFVSSPAVSTWEDGRASVGVISSSPGCSDVQEAFIVLVIYLMGVFGMVSHSVFCCRHRMSDVGNAYRREFYSTHNFHNYKLQAA